MNLSTDNGKALSARYLFEESFDEDTPERPNPQAAEAYDRGHADGRSAALEEAAAIQAQAERDVAAASEAIVQRLAEIEAMASEIGEKSVRDAISIAVEIVRKAMPAMTARHSLIEIEAVMRGALEKLRDEPRVVIRVPDAHLDALQARLEDARQRTAFAGEIVLLADERLGASDCLVEWADGGAERNLDRVWQDIEAAITRTLSEPSVVHKPTQHQGTPHDGDAVIDSTADEAADPPAGTASDHGGSPASQFT